MTLWLLPAQTTYGWRGNSRPCERIAFHFASVPSEVSEAIANQRYLAVPISTVESKRLLLLSKELEVHWKSPHQYSHLVCEKALLELSILILKSHPPRKEVQLENLVTERVERAIAWFAVNMTRNPKVDEVASALHMTGTHLRRLFRKAQRQPPHMVFRSLQMKRAIELLSTTSGTVEEISAQCGFQTATDFSRVFRQELKATPNTWRRGIMAN